MQNRKRPTVSLTRSTNLAAIGEQTLYVRPDAEDIEHCNTEPVLRRLRRLTGDKRTFYRYRERLLFDIPYCEAEASAIGAYLDRLTEAWPYLLWFMAPGLGQKKHLIEILGIHMDGEQRRATDTITTRVKGTIPVITKILRKATLLRSFNVPSPHVDAMCEAALQECWADKKAA